MNILIDGQVLETPELNRGIGIYFKNVFNNMVKRSFSNVWYISISNRDVLQFLDPWVSERITPIVNPVFAPSTDYSKAEAFTIELNKVIQEYQIDVYWNPDPLMVNVLFPTHELACEMFITIYDLIPAVMPIKEWPVPVKTEYNRRLSILKKWKNLNLICISEFTRKDVFNFCDPSLNSTIALAAADSKKFYTERTSKTLPKEFVIVFTGGFDYRKNMYGALKAYAKAFNSVSENHPIKRSKFYFVCHATDKEIQEFYSEAIALGVKNQIVLTGYISDEELKLLYSQCDVFFFPSFYEGFGLPILEAMLGGAFILSADNSSLPEVCGNHAMFCKADDVNDMANKLVLALNESLKESIEDKRERQKYALSFSWEVTADRTLQFFSDCLAHSSPEVVEKKKIAIVTPWPEQRTGIANYIYKLVPYLSKYFYIDIFADNTNSTTINFEKNPCGNFFLIDELEKQYTNYDELIFEIGNSSEYHSGVYEMLLKYTGIVEIHDFVLHPFFYHAYYLTGKKTLYRDALERAYGQNGLDHYRAIKNKTLFPDNKKFPMCESASLLGKATIFHNRWSNDQCKNTVNTHIIPLACFDQPYRHENTQTQELLLQKIGGKEKNTIIIGCFGYVNENKRPFQTVSAVKNLLSYGYKVKLIFWGNSNIPDFEKKLKSSLQNSAFISGYLSGEEYACALELTDIVVNLRYPSMGESSGTLCEAYQYSKAVLVSDVNQYKEYPDEICWKVPVGKYEQECLTSMLKYLIDNPKVRKALGENAYDYAKNVLSPNVIAKEYWKVINNIAQ